jgi:sulfur-carrier protein adenylyltransferase/sulfurtransferase
MNQRYSRQISLSEIGSEGQEKLANASVVVIGAGGLGCPALQYLAAAGVGRIGIVDGDRVELDNLHRQVLYTESDQGRMKAEAATETLQHMNGGIDLCAHTEWLNRENAMDILGKYDLVIDATDNFPTRYLINDACVMLGKPFIYGSIYRFEGQAALFNHLASDGERGPNYRDLFSEPPPAELAPDCSEAGVIGVLPGMIGIIQATEAIKVITEMKGHLGGKLLIFDAKEYDFRIVHIYSRDDNPVSGRHPTIKELIDYEKLCTPKANSGILEVSPSELNSWMQSGSRPQLLDVRTDEEHRTFNLGGKCIPHQMLTDLAVEIDPERRNVLYCRTGRRSSQVIQQLTEKGVKGTLYNLSGGIEAWKRTIQA